MSARNRYIDVVKGLGIFLVVYAHDIWIILSRAEPFRVVFSFHMPLFFFLSGVLFRPEVTFGRFVKNKADALLKPYAVTIAGLAIYQLFAGDIPVTQVLGGALYGNGDHLQWIPMWFLTHLFAVNVAALLLMRYQAPLFTGYRKYIFLAVMLTLGIAGIRLFWRRKFMLAGNEFTMPGLPFSMDLLPITMCFFLLGYWLRDHVINFKPAWLPAILSLVVFVGAHYVFDQTMDLNQRQYDGFLIPTIEALSGIYITLLAAHLVNYVTWMARPVALIGSASLFVLIFHWPIEHSISKYFLRQLTLIQTGTLLALACGLLVPVGMWLIARRSTLLSVLYLPRKTTKREPN